MTAAAKDNPTQLFRLTAGGRIDRARCIHFSFDGVGFTGHPGDTLASALLANGVHLVGRSFKYHRPRGIMAAGSEEPNALVTVIRDKARTTPNLRATQIEIHEGLVAVSQNRWPSLAFDAGAINDKLAPLLGAGFYYKTFMGPRLIGSNRLWPTLFEPLIRRAAGLGKAPVTADPDHYSSRHAHCDVLVVGAGPAGLGAALAAAEAGASVILCDEQAEFGGSLLSETLATINGLPAWAWVEAMLAALGRHERVRLLPRTTAFGVYAQNHVGLAERVTDHLAAPDPALPRERLWLVRASRVVLAAGAIEQPLVFPGNDRPGVMLAAAAITYAERFGVRLGTRAAIVTATDTGYRAALSLKRAGVEVAVIADQRPEGGGALAAEAKAQGIAIETATTVMQTSGRVRVKAATLGTIAADGRVVTGRDVACDLLLMSGGWTPAVHLFSQARGRLAWDEGRQAFLPAAPVPGMALTGGCGGVSELAAVVEAGFAAGDAAAAAKSAGRRSAPRVAVHVANAPSSAPAWVPVRLRVTGQSAGRAFVDFQNDVTAKDIQLATREGFRSIEHVKRYTTTGMATDQGKTSNLNALAIVAAATARPVAAVGLTTFRPPYTPVTFGTLAGKARGPLFDPVRRTPIDSWTREKGAIFEDVGPWQRTRYVPRAGEDMHMAVARECRTVRSVAGIFDGSTLGKIEVAGPGAAEFLDRMYVTRIASLGVGRSRYAIQLNEAGFVIDDGIVGRLAVDRFHVTTTTGGAARVLHLWEDYLQTEFTDLACWLTSVTEQWGVIAVQGPRAREIIAPLVEGVDISAISLPHMAVAEGRIAGVPMRLFRASFTGELGFEINVPAGFAREIWQRLHQRVESAGGCAYGTEAMHVLRAEKGFIIAGQESDGTVTPMDLGFGSGASKRDFVGKRALARPDLVKLDRPQLVGLLTDAPATVLEEGAQITLAFEPATGTPAEGHVTSAYMSPALGRSIALALVKGGRSRHGERLYVPMPAGAIPVTIVPPAFLDAKGERLHG